MLEQAASRWRYVGASVMGMGKSEPDVVQRALSRAIKARRLKYRIEREYMQQTWDALHTFFEARKNTGQGRLSLAVSRYEKTLIILENEAARWRLVANQSQSNPQLASRALDRAAKTERLMNRIEHEYETQFIYLKR